MCETIANHCWQAESQCIEGASREQRGSESCPRRICLTDSRQQSNEATYAQHICQSSSSRSGPGYVDAAKFTWCSFDMKYSVAERFKSLTEGKMYSVQLHAAPMGGRRQYGRAVGESLVVVLLNRPERYYCLPVRRTSMKHSDGFTGANLTIKQHETHLATEDLHKTSFMHATLSFALSLLRTRIRREDESTIRRLQVCVRVWQLSVCRRPGAPQLIACTALHHARQQELDGQSYDMLLEVYLRAWQLPESCTSAGRLRRLGSALSVRVL